MGLGSTAKKVQTLAERAEQLYTQMMELRDQISELRETVEETGGRVERLDLRSEKQWAIVQAMAEAQGIEVDAVLTDAAIEEVDAPAEGTETRSDDETQVGEADPE